VFFQPIGQCMSMKIIKITFLLLLTSIVLLLIVFWTPDTSFEHMREKYGGGSSQFLTMDNGSRIHFRDQGDPAAKVLLFIHGTSASLHTWEPLISQLGSGYRFVSLDLPGHGLTGVNPERDYSRKAMVNAVWAVMDHLDIEQASLVGNSLGGAVAWSSALDKPRRVKSLVLIAPSGAPRQKTSQSNIGFKILRTVLGQMLMKRVSPRFIIKKSLLQTVAKPEIVNEPMVDRYWELLRMQGNRQAMIDLANTPRNSDAWQRLKTIDHTSLVIWGDADGLLPVTMSDVFERELPNVNVQRLKNIGHLPMEEAVPEVSNSISNFCMINGC